MRCDEDGTRIFAYLRKIIVLPTQHNQSNN